MQKLAAFFLAAALMGGLLLPVFVSAASDIQTGSAQSFWGNLNGIYSVSGVSSSSPPYVKLTDDHWVMGTDLNVPDSIQSDMFKAGYFRTVGSTLSGSGSLSFSQSSLSFYLVLSKPITLFPGQHLEFYIYVGYLKLQNSSYERNIRYVDDVELSNYTPGGNSPSPTLFLTYDNAFYYSGSGDNKAAEYIRVHAYNGTSDSYTFNCLYLKFNTYTGSGGTINPVPAGNYTVSFQSSFSNVVTYYGDGSSVPAPDPILSEINDKIDEQNKLLMQQGQKLDNIDQSIKDLESGLLTPPDLSEWEASQMVGAAALDEFGKYKFNTFPPVPTTNPGDNYFTSQLWQVIEAVGNIGIPFSTPALEWICFGDPNRVFRLYHFILWFTTIFVTRAFIHAISAKVKEKNNPIQGDGDD